MLLICILFFFTLIVQTTMVCERKAGHMASIMTHSACTCSQDIIAEVEENGEGIQEIIDVLASGGGGGSIGGGSGGGSGKIIIFHKKKSS